MAADHPSATAADFERLTREAARYGDDGPTVKQAHDLAKCGRNDLIRFFGWQVIQDLVADGYLARVVDSKQ